MSDMIELFKQCFDPEKDKATKVSLLSQMSLGDVTQADLLECVEFIHTQQQLHFDCPGAIDVVGTGGSGLPRINTSTLTSIVLASMGYGVTKHGNNASSGRFGSFDLLQNLGYPIPMTDEALANAYTNHGLVFQYAKKFYPIFRHAGAARKQYAKPTIFNLLGPLLNPSGCDYQLIGCSFVDHLDTMATVASHLGRKRVAVVRGSDGLDEVTLTGPTKVSMLSNGRIEQFEVTPEEFGCAVYDFTEIAGGDADTNSRLAVEILQGTCTSRHLDLVCVNVAMGLFVLGEITKDELALGYCRAKEHIVSGGITVPVTKFFRGGSVTAVQCNSKILQGKRLFKACGIRGAVDSQLLEDTVDMVGINCVPSSKRYLDEDGIVGCMQQMPASLLTIALFQDAHSDEVIRIAKQYGFDGVQLHGSESPDDCQRCVEAGLLVIKALPYDQIDRISDYAMVSCFIIDAKQGGSGESYDYTLLSGLQGIPFLIAGGVSSQNISKIMSDCPNCLGVDVASGIESEGRIDYAKVKKIRDALDK